MIASLALSFAVPWIVGSCLVSLASGPAGEGSRLHGEILRVSAGFPLGVGVISSLSFAWILVIGTPAGFLVFEVLLGLGGAAGLCWMYGKSSLAGSGASKRKNLESPERSDRVYPASFLAALSVAGAVFLIQTLAQPHGGWDAWAMWNMKGRFLYRGGEYWQDIFSAGPAFHLDYPMLLPGFLARTWGWIGWESPVVPALTSVLFSFSAAGALCSSLALSRGRAIGYVAGACLLGTPAFLREGAMQQADIPVGVYFLLAGIFFSLREKNGGMGYLSLAGLSLGLGSWTKNEGALFVVAFCAGYLGIRLYRGRGRELWKEVPWFAAGLLPPLLLLAWFKWRYVPPDALLDRNMLGGFGGMLDLSRHLLVTKGFLREFLGFGLPVYIVYCLAGFRSRKEPAAGDAVSVLWVVLAIVITADYLVFVTHPLAIQYVLGSSARRVLLQIWPATLYAILVSSGRNFQPAAKNSPRS